MKAHDRDHLDDWLDNALRQYGNAEPRIGLESRILANMEAAGKRALLGCSYGWLLAATSAAALLIGIWFGIWHRPQSAPKAQPILKIAGDVGKQIGSKIIPAARGRHKGMQRRRQVNEASTVELAGAPKLEQFPSPRPLSQQEILLARYVQHFPTEAVLIAQRQGEFQQEIEQAEQEMKTISRSSERQER
jgi:xanthosine utilization system XapX-like protein